ncbi:YXWGXW repeat-containing protein [Lacipirellula parvula]|uniref:YXWGXW repeat-containing protein n=1 Tax=Lacipirellula parvula TaxID=2650471 RepID=UPI0012611082|nr:YXWGXW repeat-containing protein [Lacipirellula parvula]
MKRSSYCLIASILAVSVAAIGGDTIAQVVVETPAVVEAPVVVEAPTVVETPVVAAPAVIEPVVVSPTYIPVPAPQQEVITPAPSTGGVWVAGHWDRTPDQWVWNQGAWVEPPFSNAYWTPGYWQHQNGQYVWEDAHWAAANQGVVVAKPVAVPEAYEEVVPAAPAASTAMTWQPGHWEWRGTWVWIPGAYVATAVPATTWVNGAWVEGVDGWHWMPGHWQE